MSTEIAASIILCILLLAASCLLVPENRHKRFFIAAVLFSMLIRIALVAYLYNGRVDSFGTDGLLYHQEGIRIADQIADGVPFYSVDYSYSWYTVFIGLIYHIFGINRYIVSYINIAFVFLSAILLFKIAYSQKQRFELASFVSLVFLYFPNLILWTSDSRKESATILICLLVWYCVFKFIENLIENKKVTASNIVRIAFVCFLMWLGTLIRIYMFIPLAIGIIACQLMFYKKLRKKLFIVFAVAVFISSVLIMTLTVMPSLDTYHAIDFEKSQVKGASGCFGSKIGTIAAIASNRNIFESVIEYILLPYPGDIDINDINGNKLIEAVVSADIIVWYICIALMIPGIVTSFKKRNGLFIGLFAFIAVYVIINALVVENVADTIYRYRSVIVGTSLLFIDTDSIKKLIEHNQSFKIKGFPVSKGN